MEKQTLLPKGYLEGFNNGYALAKHYPVNWEKLFSNHQTVIGDEFGDKLKPIDGVIHGMQQAEKERKLSITKEALIELDDLRNQLGDELDHEMDVE